MRPIEDEIACAHEMQHEKEVICLYSLLIAVIYLAFVSLGLPDSLLGSAWPVLHNELNVPLSYAGIVTMIIAAGTVVSSLFSDKIIRKLGTWLVTVISVGMTAAALYGFHLATSFAWLCILAVPYGLGAGAVDAALNNYAALHYSSRHMSWLHASWGVGAAISPYIMSACLTGGSGWRSGYLKVSLLQMALTAILLISFPLWKGTRKSAGEQPKHPQTMRKILSVRGVFYVMLAFFSYCAMESTTGLWASTYLVEHHQVGAETAASYASLFFMGIMTGRFLCGIVADRFGDRKMIRVGGTVILVGLVLMLLPLKTSIFALIGLCVMGLGCAPVYPSFIHSTPANFGADNSQAIVGVKMASAYVGSTFMPPVFGVIAQKINVGLYPVYLLLFAVLMLCMSEKLNRACRKNG